MKKLLTIVLLVLLSAGMLFSSYLQDDEKALDSEAAARVEAYLSSVSEKAGFPVMVKTRAAKDYSDIERQTEEFDYDECEDFLILFGNVEQDYLCVFFSRTLMENISDDWFDYVWNEYDKGYAESGTEGAFKGFADSALRLEDYTTAEESSHIVDKAGLLTESELSSLDDALVGYSIQAGFPIYVVTDVSTYGKSAMAAADDLLEELADGPDGVLLLVDMGERNFWISTMGKAIEALPTSKLQKIEDQFVSSLSAGNYAEAFRRFGYYAVDYAYSLSSGYSGTSGTSEGAEVSDEVVWGSLAGISLVVGLIIGGVSIAIMKKKLHGARMVDDASIYAKAGSFVVTERKDIFLFSNVSRTKIESSSSSNGTHHSSSGISHGGHGGRF